MIQKWKIFDKFHCMNSTCFSDTKMLVHNQWLHHNTIWKDNQLYMNLSLISAYTDCHFCAALWNIFCMSHFTPKHPATSSSNKFFKKRLTESRYTSSLYIYKQQLKVHWFYFAPRTPCSSCFTWSLVRRQATWDPRSPCWLTCTKTAGLPGF